MQWNQNEMAWAKKHGVNLGQKTQGGLSVNPDYQRITGQTSGGGGGLGGLVGQVIGQGAKQLAGKASGFGKAAGLTGPGGAATAIGKVAFPAAAVGVAGMAGFNLAKGILKGRQPVRPSSTGGLEINRHGGTNLKEGDELPPGVTLYTDSQGNKIRSDTQYRGDFGSIKTAQQLKNEGFNFAKFSAGSEMDTGPDSAETYYMQGAPSTPKAAPPPPPPPRLSIPKVTKKAAPAAPTPSAKEPVISPPASGLEDTIVAPTPETPPPSYLYPDRPSQTPDEVINKPFLTRRGKQEEDEEESFLTRAG